MGMRAGQIEVVAVFHDRRRMEEAVRGLLGNGMPAKRIRIERGGRRVWRDRRARRPASASMLALGIAMGATSGAALTLVWMLWLSDVVGLPLPLIVQQTADAGASGGILGALLAGFVLAAHRKDPYELDTSDAGTAFLVTVRPPNAAVADDVWRLFASRGGELVANEETHDALLSNVSGYRACWLGVAGNFVLER